MPGRVGVVVVVAGLRGAAHHRCRADIRERRRRQREPRLPDRADRGAREAVRDLQAEISDCREGNSGRSAGSLARRCRQRRRVRRDSAAPPDSPRSPARASGSSSTTRLPPTPTPSTSATPTWPCSSTRCGPPARRRSRSTGSGSRPYRHPQLRHGDRGQLDGSHRRTSSRPIGNSDTLSSRFGRDGQRRRTSPCWPVTTAGAYDVDNVDELRLPACAERLRQLRSATQLTDDDRPPEGDG